MKKSRLNALLRPLKPKELRKLRKFVSSPFFNQQQCLVDLLAYSIENISAPLNKKATYAHLFPTKPFNETDLRLQVSYLCRLIEKFIAYTEIEADPSLLLQKTAEGLTQRNQKEEALRILQKSQARIEKQPLRNATYFENRYRIELSQYAYEAVDKPTEAFNMAAFQNLDTAYFINKLKLACQLLSHQTTYQSSYDLSSLSTVLQEIQSRNLLETPIVATYYYCYLTLTEPTIIQHFHQFKNLLLQHSSLLADRETRDLYLLAINFCIKQINQGEEAFFTQALKLYKGGLNNEALLVNGVLSRFTYHNIVIAGLHNKEFDWVEQFIHQYRKSLERRFQESSFSFSKARLEYHRKNYDGVLELLQKANYRDVLLNLSAKTLLVKVYYELSELDLLYSHLEAMKTFIRRKRVIGYHKTNYLNIVSFTQKLLGLNDYDKKAVDDFVKAVEAVKVLTEKKWLLEQAVN